MYLFFNEKRNINGLIAVAVGDTNSIILLFTGTFIIITLVLLNKFSLRSTSYLYALTKFLL